MSDFEQELQSLLNRNCKENGSGTPDFILANYMSDCLSAFNAATNRREAWYGREQDQFGMPVDKPDVIDEVLNVPPNTHDPETGIKLVNYGHGHVFPRADGALARCGGPGLCAECARDKVKFDALEKSSWVIMIEQTLNEQSKAIKKLQERLEKPSGAKEKGMKEGAAFGVTPVQTSPGHWEVPD